ncbi:MAG: hypothetical protein HN704_08535 [Bacteroidetes bacterium]|jgi:hypothetical protein|nr:hypothetical protein [Bacteroidota bacterium]MBT6687445.1 hypothetical protein [Bacteroidota bacterium]MBT7143363.1 hypothetical protein [Bacteroidota bacterium]MBT7491639.1 hypothetical protein [Bacteroidota bacterium]
MALSSLAGIYHNSSWREHSYACLLGNSIKYFQKSYVISNFELLEKQWNESISGINPLSISHSFFEENLIDKIKITLCFENYFKGIFIKKGYLVHLIDTKIGDKKFKSLGDISKHPIKVSSYKQIENLVFDQESGNKTYRGLKNQTVTLNVLLNNPSYIDIHKTPQNILDIIKKMNKERNSLHLKIINAASYNEEYISNLKLLIEFVNKKMIKEYNRLVRKFRAPEYWERFYYKEITVPNRVGG